MEKFSGLPRSVGLRLREERLRFGLSQTDFSKMLGVSRRTQTLYENDGRDPGGLYLYKAQEFGVDVHYVLTGRRESAPLEELSGEAKELLAIFNSLVDRDRDFILRIAETLTKTSRSANPHSAHQHEDG
ncbi:MULTISPECIES: helix-turn-helix domain-containing protein [Pseudomonas]|uniref:Helix-turn-helix domain-containing protein n=1 Tax=Pseudomonas taiwanensis TaxID=470150 RepID=A0ABR6V5C9_9PSED|nr:helix-turn-helix domain-containing protein [Pseudomonas taiwanensis]QXI32055.1 helix-turn-helix domain-containing protein [Pseudomonas promysalinigenes]